MEIFLFFRIIRFRLVYKFPFADIYVMSLNNFSIFILTPRKIISFSFPSVFSSLEISLAAVVEKTCIYI